MPTQIKSYKYKRICDHPNCNNEFQTNMDRKRFCSNVCNHRWHFTKRYKAGKIKPKPNQQRYCKVCNIEIPKGKHYCEAHRLELQKESKKYRRLNDPKIKTINQIEIQIIVEHYTNATNPITTEVIKLIYNKIGIKRSQVFIIKHAKRLGVYKLPDMNKVIWDRDLKFREARELEAKKGEFEIIDNNVSFKDVEVKCKVCSEIIKYKTIVKTGCWKCKVKQREEEKQRIKSENLDNKNSAKIKEYSNRVERIKQYISKEDNYIDKESWKETEVYKEYKWYNSKMGIPYREEELTYKLKWITYYQFKNSGRCPDKAKHKDNKICNVCKIEKPITEFMGRGKRNSCKECAKEYRREFLLEGEVKRTRERYKNDPLFKLDSLIRSYVYGALKGRLKTKRIRDILGISADEFKQYIEERFEDWMNWDNHGMGEGKWALQHIIPRDYATNEKEIYLLNHYQNFIPMCAIQNGILKNRIIDEQLGKWHKSNKDIQKILKRNKDSIISEREFKTQYNIIEIKPNKQTEQKLNKWFAY